MRYSKASKLFFVTLSCALVFLFAGCTKNVAGPKGDAGTPGKPGNLKQSAVNLQINSSSWSLNVNTWEATVYLSGITKDVVEKGEVKLYISADSQWCGMPYGKGYIFTQYSIEREFIHLNCTHIHGGIPSRPATADYRAVIFYPAQ